MFDKPRFAVRAVGIGYPNAVARCDCDIERGVLLPPCASDFWVSGRVFASVRRRWGLPLDDERKNPQAMFGKL